MHITPAQARVAFERLTHYGPGYTVEVAWHWIDVHKEVDLFFVEGEAWPVQYQPHCSQVSRLSVLIVKVMFRIFFHTDLTYYDHMPGVKDLNVSFYSFLFQTIFLHCIEQHEGEVKFDNFWGQVVKYFRVVRLCWSTLSTLHKSFARSIPKCKSPFFLREFVTIKHPRYQLLSNTVASFRDVGTDYIKFDSISQQPFFVWVQMRRRCCCASIKSANYRPLKIWSADTTDAASWWGWTGRTLLATPTSTLQSTRWTSCSPTSCRWRSSTGPWGPLTISWTRKRITSVWRWSLEIWWPSRTQGLCMAGLLLRS